MNYYYLMQMKHKNYKKVYHIQMIANYIYVIEILYFHHKKQVKNFYLI